jgi:hypothetical protein
VYTGDNIAYRSTGGLMQSYRIIAVAKEAAVSVLIGVMTSAILAGIINLVGGYDSPMLASIVLLTRIALIIGGFWKAVRQYQYADIPYLGGWMLGTLLVLDILDPPSIWVNLMLPAVIIVGRIIQRSGYFSPCS